MNINIEHRKTIPTDEGIRFNHNGFLTGSTWIDTDIGETVQIAGEGIAGMPEVALDNGDTYYCNPLSLIPYDAT